EEGHFELNMVPPAKSSGGALVTSGFPVENAREVWISLGLIGTGVAEGLIVEPEAFNVTLEAPDGTRWNSGWKPVYSILEHNEGGITEAANARWSSLGATFAVDRKVIDRIKDPPVNIHVVTAATLFRDHTDAPMVPTGGELKVPGLGTCLASQYPSTALWCRSPLGDIPMLGVNIRLFKSCATGTEGPVTSLETHAWAPRVHWGGDFGLSPVTVFTLMAPHEVSGQSLTTCAGSTF